MISDEFNKLIEDYKNNPSLIEKIRNYILNNLYDEEEIDKYIDLFSSVSKEIDDKVGYALSLGMYFWLYHGSNIELAHDYNNKAIEIYHTIDDYKYKTGYLSVLNNELIYNNYKANLYDSYQIMSEGMDIAEETKNINYFYSFAVNGFYLLLDLGLTDKAFEMLKKLESNNASLSLAEKSIMIILKIKVYSKFDKKEALSHARKMLEINEKEHIFEYYLVYAYMVECLISNDLIDEAKIYIDKITSELATKENYKDNVDVSEAYSAYGKYYLKINNKAEAFKYYKILFPKYNTILGNKHEIINESINIFKEYDHELYIKALEAKSKLLDEINNTFVLAASNDKKLYESFLDLRYRYLFEKMQKLTTFISEINSLDTKANIDSLIEENIKDILGASKVKVIIEKESFVYKGLHISNVDGIKYFESKELSDEIRENVDSVACIKVSKDKVGDYLYILIGLPCMGNLETKENTYMISLIKETLSPVLLQIDRFNEAVSNYSRDELTKLYNRYGLNNIVSQVRSLKEEPYLLMIDIDDFKLINDTYGHDEGDVILTKFAKTLKETLGDECVARIGGEEFVGLVNRDENNINLKLDDLQKNISKIKIGSKSLTVTIGVAKLTSDSDFNDVKNKADKALYKAKNNGKNQYLFYTVNKKS